MKRVTGFTLIELLISITILALVITLALPSFIDFIKRYQSKVKQQELFGLLMLMRTKAYNENLHYTLCPQGQNDVCADNWSRGALLFADMDKDGELDSGERIERKLESLKSNASLSWMAFNNKGSITFKPDGKTPSQSGNFSYCPATGEAKYGWIIILNAIGRPYYAKDKNGNGIVENGSGEDLVCPKHQSS
ncbi:GspH/FimT family pseudopilin [uncultured Microbulbifer sp.]|uniref:GspH/FimT family pseudopilin n=1 Tax=uncultured Microbulbifer sp. TaxID=348147 RepID=UPI0026152CF3|nr:GspH/FimT family pseudopilin [uncultured Microbulbifer sp.]